MLADYLPSEDDPEYEEKLRMLPEYEASLASRYPPVCSDCAPRVQERITERDQFARSWSLGRWLDLKKKASNADLANGIAGQLSASDDKHADRYHAPLTSDPSRSHPRFSIRGIVGSMDNGSPLAMAVFAFTNVGLWSAYLWTALWPQNTAAVVHQVMEQTKRAPFSLFTATTGLMCLFLVPWLLTMTSKLDPLGRRIERARSRQLRVEAKGLTFWHSVQSMLLRLRLSLLLVMISASLSPRTPAAAASEWLELRTGRTRIGLLGLAAAAFLMGEIGLTSLAASRLGIQAPAALQLVSRPILANAKSSKPSNQHNDALLTSLSLDDRAVGPPPASGMAPERDDDLVAEPGMVLPRMDRDADGDAVMEDAATYAARRNSLGDDSDQDDARLFTPTSAWAGQWSKTAASQQPSFVASSKQAASATRTGSSTYTDFQLGPQRFWEPQNPTGLEDVFGRAVSLDDRAQQQADGNRNAGSSGKWSQWFGFS
ncbi:Ima1_N domain-containing protein [Pseudozyma hubeiensis]|nr:Ima1_N domain-containing protein [Pseudozyma hubeiensis]